MLQNIFKGLRIVRRYLVWIPASTGYSPSLSRKMRQCIIRWEDNLPPVTLFLPSILSIIYDMLSLINFTSLRADIIPWCVKKPVPMWWLAFPFHRKMYTCLLAECHHCPICPIWPPALPLDLTWYFDNLLACFQWTCTMQTPNILCSKSHIYFLFHRLFQRIHPILRTCVTFHNRLFFVVSSY
jgi:hypothetical protein